MMAVANSPQTSASGSNLIALLVALVAIPGGAAVWTGTAVIVSGNAPWMAVLAALDAALLLRLVNLPPGIERARWGLGITVATILAAAALIATARVGLVMGMRPAESISKMSFGLGWLWLQSNSSWVDWLWALGGSLLGWRLAK